MIQTPSSSMPTRPTVPVSKLSAGLKSSHNFQITVNNLLWLITIAFIVCSASGNGSSMEILNDENELDAISSQFGTTYIAHETHQSPHRHHMSEHQHQRKHRIFNKKGDFFRRRNRNGLMKNDGNHMRANDISKGNARRHKYKLFGTENSTTVVTQIGAVAHLPCVVLPTGAGVVTWIRRKDYHLLTVGSTRYSSDTRHSVAHELSSKDWTLQIKYVQANDEGWYECQLSVHPPVSIFIKLRVVEARAEIVGPQVKYLTPDSTLRLICRIEDITEPAKFIFWYHDTRMINYDVDRGINVSIRAGYSYSELVIAHAGPQHSGNYSCVPSNAVPSFCMVHIFKGDIPAAMHHEHSLASTVFINHTCILLMVSLYMSLVGD